MSSKPAPPALLAYFGRMDGSPPGLPGGGITGVLPTSGVGARISGSIPAGGHNTPSDLASLSLSGSARRPVVAPSGATVPCCGAACVGAQLVARGAGGGAVCAGGVAGDGGACASAAPVVAISAHGIRSESLIRIRGNGPRSRMFPAKTAQGLRIVCIRGELQALR